MEPSRANRTGLRARGKHAALTLAAEQAEEQALKWALRLVAKCERRLQQRENRKEIRRITSSASAQNKGKRKRLPQHLDEARLSVVECDKVPREDVQELTKLLVHLFQRSLRRCHLRKGARATFSVRLSRSEFLQIFGGHAPIKEHANGKLFVVFNAKDTPALNAQLGPMLNIGKGDKHWHCRRALRG